MDFLDSINRELDERGRKKGNMMDLADEISQKVLAHVDLSTVIKRVMAENHELSKALEEPRVDAGINRKTAQAVHTLLRKIVKDALQ